jgi:hypothetical protein
VDRVHRAKWCGFEAEYGFLQNYGGDFDEHGLAEIGYRIFFQGRILLGGYCVLPQ